MAQKQDRTKDKAKVRCGIIYMENIPQGIDMVVEELRAITSIYRNLSILISPLHEPDEEAKKPHYHVLFVSSTELVIDTYDKILERYKGTKSLKVFSAKKYTRYLLHLDNPEKQQFKGGISDLYYINCNRSEIEQDLRINDEMQFVADVFEYMTIECCKHGLKEFLEYEKNTKDICTYKEALKYVAGHAYFITQILKGWQFNERIQGSCN